MKFYRHTRRNENPNRFIEGKGFDDYYFFMHISEKPVAVDFNIRPVAFSST